LALEKLGIIREFCFKSQIPCFPFPSRWNRFPGSKLAVVYLELDPRGDEMREIEFTQNYRGGKAAFPAVGRETVI